MRKFLTLLLMTPIFALPAFAQNDEYHKFEVSGGYSYQRATDDIDSIGFNGFNASATGNLSKYVGLKFDLSGHYKKLSEGGFSANLSTYNYLGGIQLKNNSKEKKVKPFAHLLAGGVTAKARASNPLCVPPPGNPSACFITIKESGFAMAVGGGLDVKVSKRVDIRVFQADYNPNRLGGSWNNNFRVGFGIVIH